MIQYRYKNIRTGERKTIAAGSVSSLPRLSSDWVKIGEYDYSARKWRYDYSEYNRRKKELEKSKTTTKRTTKRTTTTKRITTTRGPVFSTTTSTTRTTTSPKFPGYPTVEEMVRYLRPYSDERFIQAIVKTLKADPAARRTWQKQYYEKWMREHQAKPEETKKEETIEEKPYWRHPDSIDVYEKATGRRITAEEAKKDPNFWDKVEVNPNAPKTNIGALPKDFQDLLDRLTQYLADLKKRGQMPEVKELTEDEIAKFLKQAEKEIEPYYATQLKLAREGFLRSLGYTTEDIQRFEEGLEEEYGRELRILGEEMAERGFAESGIRKRAERELAWDTQRKLEEARRRALFEIGTQARELARVWGEKGLPSAPTIPAMPQVVAGRPTFERPTRTSPLYELSPEVYKGLIGEKEWEKKTAIQTRKAELVGAERQKRQLEALRKLKL